MTNRLLFSQPAVPSSPWAAPQARWTRAPWLVPLALLSAACAPALRDARPDRSLRQALGVAEPRALHRVLGVDLAVHDSDPSGQKPALVCLHAIGHGGGDFAQVEQALAAQYRIVTVDWPGQGFSGDDPQPASALRYVALLEALVADLHLEPFAILGNSIGGAAAIRFAAAHPEQVRALVLANPGGLDPGGLLAGLFIGHLVGRFERGVRGEARFARWYEEYYNDILITPAAAARRQAIVAAGYEHAALLVQAWRSFAQEEARLLPLLPKLSMPVLFTWARRDGLIQWSRNEAAARSVPGARVAFFEAGHSAFLETPAGFLREVTPFLSSALSPRGRGTLR